MPLRRTCTSGCRNLSNADTRELAADIDDRVFKEASRRLQQNITATDPGWDEENLGPKELYAAPLPSDAELDKLAEKEEKEGWTPPPDPNAGSEGDIPEDTSPDEEEATAMPVTAAAAATVATTAVSVSAERLAAPVTTKTAAPAPTQTVETPVQPVSPPPPPAPQAPRAYKGTDPYREPVE